MSFLGAGRWGRRFGAASPSLGIEKGEGEMDLDVLSVTAGIALGRKIYLFVGFEAGGKAASPTLPSSMASIPPSLTSWYAGPDHKVAKIDDMLSPRIKA